MKTTKHKLAHDTTIARPGVAYKGKAGDQVDWPEDIVARVKADEKARAKKDAPAKK